MTTFSIEITKPAEKDLYDIALYFSKELLEPETAKSVIRKISEAIDSLSKLPKRNAIVSDERLANRGIRKIIIDKYIIFYIVSERNRTVTIIRILYGRRDWLNLLV